MQLEELDQIHFIAKSIFPTNRTTAFIFCVYSFRYDRMNKEDLREHYRHVAILRLLLASSYLAFRESSSADMRSLLLDILDTTTRFKLMNHFNASQYLIFLYACHSCAIIFQQILIYETEDRQTYLRSDASSTLYNNDSTQYSTSIKSS